MVYTDLSEVQRQPTNLVRRLSVVGDPRERLWAAWTLGLRDVDAQTWLAQRARIDPSPGVRRHLAVMMAGFRRLDVLWALTCDPHPRVRATAIVALCRLSPNHDVVAWDRIMPRLMTDAVEVRCAILRELPADPRPDVERVWPEALGDGSTEVRAAALDRIAARPRPHLLRAVAARLGGETDPGLRRRMRGLLRPTSERPDSGRPGADEPGATDAVGARPEAAYPLMCIN